jgi:hypothetical protein
MKISEIFDLNMSQAELDFVDIDPTEDLPLFLDPFFLSKRNDNWSIEASLTLKSFFQNVIDAIRNGNEEEAKDLFNHLHEPNATCLGMSRGNPQGRGVGFEDTDKIYDSLLSSRAIQTGLIQDIEDNIFFVENFGKDKLSDMTTNIITKHLIEYTQTQCNLLNIPLTSGISSEYFWNKDDDEWQNEHTDMLVINGKKILLVPKGIVSFSKAYTPDTYYNRFVLEYLQNEHLRMRSALVEKRRNGTRFVTKKRLKEDYPQTKGFLRTFTQQHPEVLEQFKQQTNLDSLSNSEFSDINIREITRGLIRHLQGIPAGSANATDYHRTMVGILGLLFYPNLINPKKEIEINSGRKRIDITFDNAAKEGIFYRLPQNQRIPCPYIFVECKNYSTDVANPELDQIGGRFSIHRGQVGFIVCRTIDNFPLFLKRCKDTFSDGRGLIVPLIDDDIITLLQNYNDNNSDFIEKFLADRIRDITIN